MIIGMVSTRFAGLDGVTLESKKVAAVLEEAGHTVVWFAGKLGPEFESGFQYPPAFFGTDHNLELQHRSFGTTTRPAGTIEMIRSEASAINRALHAFVEDFDVDVLMPQNALSIPMHLPLGLGITDFVLESGIPSIAHHHDFFWERTRFWPNAVPDILYGAFPPPAPSMQHIVINSFAKEEFARRRAIAATLLPNVMDFEHPPEPVDPTRFRTKAGLKDGDRVLLQSTRRIPRKNIELTLELANELADPAVKVIVTHPEHDEEGAYWEFLCSRAERLGVDLRFVPTGEPGRPTLEEAYAAADLVTFPSLIEGFGNALLEAVYYSKPVFVNRYPVYVRDIAPTGLQCLEVDGHLTLDVVRQVAALLEDRDTWADTVERNYEIGAHHFSYKVLRRRLLPMLVQ